MPSVDKMSDSGETFFSFQPAERFAGTRKLPQDLPPGMWGMTAFPETGRYRQISIPDSMFGDVFGAASAEHM